MWRVFASWSFDANSLEIFSYSLFCKPARVLLRCCLRFATCTGAISAVPGSFPWRPFRSGWWRWRWRAFRWSTVVAYSKATCRDIPWSPGSLEWGSLADCRNSTPENTQGRNNDCHKTKNSFIDDKGSASPECFLAALLRQVLIHTTRLIGLSRGGRGTWHVSRPWRFFRDYCTARTKLVSN